jgi:indole-3-glycerol phosphate synthase
MAFYGMAYREVRELPMQTFWMLHRNVDRISAERDQRNALVQIQSQSSEGVKDLMTDLRKQVGTIIEFEEAAPTKLDRKALHALDAIGDLKNNAYPG